jgi:Zn-dependent oligopeptidase
VDRRQHTPWARDFVLSRGMTVEPMSMFAAFRGRDLDTKALLKRRGLL